MVEQEVRSENSVLLSVLKIHFAEFAALWGQWLNQLDSDELTTDDLAEIEGRIDAHLDGLLIGGFQSVALCHEAIVSDDEDAVFAASILLIKLGKVDEVMNAFANPDSVCEAIKDAFCYCPFDGLQAELEKVLNKAAKADDGDNADDGANADDVDDAEEVQAALAAEALAFHGLLNRNHPKLKDFFSHEDTRVRSAAWRAVRNDPR